MPELPEVETIATQLDKNLAGKHIVGLDILFAKSFIGKQADIDGAKVKHVSRRAKVLYIQLDNGFNLVFHLKMTGQLIYIDHNHRIAGGHATHDWHAKLPNSHTRLIFDFGNDQKLYFNDMRKFGWCKVMTDKELNNYFQDNYGPEPENLTVEYLKSKAAKMSKAVIKKFLMDQKVIAGIGNIYADETLYAAKIHPKQLVSTLSDTEWETILREANRILKFAVKQGGTTDSDYVNAYGKKGGMQDYLKVYHHAGEPCPNSCGGTIERIVVGGRGTHFCPNCQQEHK